MQGMLLVDKPVGWTSFDAVNYIRRVVATAENKKPKNIKVGHSGTLDPFASGLLILLVGKEYTRRAAMFSKLDKTYEVTMLLGQTSSTGDPEGEITRTPDLTATHQPDRQALISALQQFVGTISQVPPIYSAIKIQGQRAYKLARAGTPVTMESREVTIKRITLTSYVYPEATFVAEVSSGTYIRSLVEDIGGVVGTGAYTSALRRIAIDHYDVANAVFPQDFDPDVLQKFV